MIKATFLLLLALVGVCLCGDVYNKWEEIDYFGYIPPMYAATAQKYQDLMVIFGGSDGATSFSDVYAFNLTTQKVDKMVVQGPGPEARSFHSSVYEEHSAFIFGGKGIDGSFLNDLWQLDMKNWKWTKKIVDDVSIPAPRAGHTAVLSSDKNFMYVFGGWNNEDGSFQDTWKIHLHGGIGNPKWQKIVYTSGEVPGARANHTCNMIKLNTTTDMMYCSSGIESSYKPYADLWEFDCFTNSWRELHPAGATVFPNYYHYSVVVGTKDRPAIFVYSGSSQSVFVYHPKDNFWSQWTPSGTDEGLFASTGIHAEGVVYMYGGFSWHGDAEYKLFKYEYDPCALYTECDACQSDAARKANCGWCSKHGICQSGTKDGPADEECTGDKMWKWQTVCPKCATGKLSKRPQGCKACLAEPGCGWCTEDNICSEGEKTGPFYEAPYCSTWRYGQGSANDCPNCGALKTCETCAADPRCGYCWATQQCKEGSIVWSNSCAWGWDAEACVDCTQFKDCGSCNNNLMQGIHCGWCGSSQSCMHGDFFEPYQTCGHYMGDTCIDCSHYTNCSTCNDFAKTFGRCGWCSTNQQCMNGDEASPAWATCTDWRYGPSHCHSPSDDCHLATNCGDCILMNQCGWCGNYDSCLYGDKKGSHDPKQGPQHQCRKDHWRFSTCNKPLGGNPAKTILLVLLIIACVGGLGFVAFKYFKNDQLRPEGYMDIGS